MVRLGKPAACKAISPLQFLWIGGPSLLWLLLLLSLFHRRDRIRASRPQCFGLPFEVGCLRQKLIAIALNTNCVGLIDCFCEAVGSHCGVAGSSRLL